MVCYVFTSSLVVKTSSSSLRQKCYQRSTLQPNCSRRQVTPSSYLWLLESSPLLPWIFTWIPSLEIVTSSGSPNPSLLRFTVLFHGHGILTGHYRQDHLNLGFLTRMLSFLKIFTDFYGIYRLSISIHSAWRNWNLEGKEMETIYIAFHFPIPFLQSNTYAAR